MRPQLLKISLPPGHSFSSRHDVTPVFYNKWHYHSELELIYIINGSGSLFIGYDIIQFKKGDLVLVGSLLPHMWGSVKNRAQHTGHCESYVIHFLPDCLGPGFFELPENKQLHSLFEKAQKGLLIGNAQKDKIVPLMEQLMKAGRTERIIKLLEILQLITSTKDNRALCSEGFSANVSAQDSERLSAIYQYIMNNFSRQIRLSRISAEANLAPNSFCRYFKSRTRKSFTRFLMEVRINHACKLLAETERSVADICYDCGYNSFSNFNRHFKLIMMRTPLTYRKSYET